MQHVRICFLGLTILITGCVNHFATSEGETNTISLLRDKTHHYGMGGNMVALDGTLTLVNGCFLIMGQGGTGVSPVWPNEFSYQENVGGIEIDDGSGRIVARVGEHIIVSGSSFSDLEYTLASTNISGNLNCPKPFWGVMGISPRP